MQALIDARRAAALTALASALWLAQPAGAATGTYSSGDLSLEIPDPGLVESPVSVGDAGAVAAVAVSLRVAHPNVDDLEVTLVAPDGTAVLLANHPGGEAADFGSGTPGCVGTLTVFEDDPSLPPIAEGQAPFAGAFQPEEPFDSLLGKEAQGVWKLRVEDDNAEDAGRLLCWKLELDRAVVETRVARAGAVRAEVSFRRLGHRYADARLRIVRRGRLAFHGVPNGGCRECRGELASDRALRALDLDGDREPEVLVDLYTGGAHCCTFTLVYRWDAGRRAYRKAARWWGNAGYRIRDLDRDARPELLSADDRFAYAFAAYADSAGPVQAWSYRSGRFADVTGSFPGLVRRDAGRLEREYRARRAEGRADVRGVLAALVADRLLLGEGGRGWKLVLAALAAGELDRPGVGPHGRAYLAALRRFLVETGYVAKADAARLLPI